MNLFRTFLIIISITLSLFAFIGSDIDHSNTTDCSNLVWANAKIFDINSSECVSMSGGVDGPTNNDDLFIFRVTEDMNISYSISNDTSSDHEIEYAISEGSEDSCVDANITLAEGAEVNGTINNVNSSSYLYFRVHTDYNQPSTYYLSVAKDGILCAGGGGIPGDINASLHVANIDIYDGYTYTAPDYTSWIQTKTSNRDGYILNAIYLGTGESTPLVPQPYNGGSGGSTASITVQLKLADFSDPATTCANATPIDLFTTVGGNTPVVAVIDDGVISSTTNSFIMAYAPDNITPLSKKNVRFMYKSIDFNQLIIDSGIQCAQKSSTGGVVEGIPACLISDSLVSQAVRNYEQIFGTDAVTNCYTLNGQPCYASNGGVGAPPYDHEYGCFECSIGSLPYICSADNFAIRPNEFELASTDKHIPDLLRSGADYNMSIRAYDFATTATTSQDYNQEKANLTVNESTVLAADGSATVLNGTANWGANDFNISNGISIFGASNEVVSINFNDVGKVNIEIKDKNWAEVDINNADDPTAEDCTVDGAYICGDTNLTFIPHHFGFTDINITNSDNNGSSSNFTYISNLEDGNTSTYTMSGRIQVTVVAQSESNGTATNFRDGPAYYENPVSLSSAVSHVLQGDANTTTINTAILGFANGEKTIAWNEANLSIVLRFNFPREVNATTNPFVVSASDTNLSALSTYTQPAVIGYDSSADINGSENGLGDGNATMIYGRTHASRQRYEGNSGTANIYYEAYCFGTDSKGKTCNKNLLPNGLASKRTDDTRWFINTNHRDGSGTAGTTTQINGLNIVTGTTTTGNHPDSSIINYIDTTKGYPYKTTMENSASQWLIYNKDDPLATRNQFSVEFDIAGAGWSGAHDTNTTTGDTGATKTNRRIMW